MREGSGRRLGRLAVAALTAAGLATGLAVGATGGAAAAVTAPGLTSPGATANSTWDDGMTPDAKAPTADLLRGISCTSVKNCVAVGANLNGPVPLAESWNGSAWKITGAKLPKGGTEGQLGGVSCVTAKDCVAAGYYAAAGGSRHPLAETWNGATWTTAAPPGTAGLDTALAGISCVTGKDCLAVGAYSVKSVDGPFAEPLADLWNGKAWTSVKVKLPPQQPETFDNQLNAVSCPTAAFCVAVGGVAAVNSSALLIEAWNGTFMSPMKPAALPRGFADQTLEGVSCVSVKSCVAVGLGSAGGGVVSFSETWNGTAWSYAKMTWPKGTRNPEIWAVGCRTASYCVAGGDTGQNLNVEGRTGQAAITVWNGKTWVPARVPTVGPGKHSVFDSVSCKQAFCAAAGQYGPAESTNGSGLTAFATGSTWKLVGAK
jgi:hypothetical protein